jgi:caffeoyl-CoA O-methyltransferase
VILEPAMTRYLSGLEPEPDALLAEMRAHGDRDRIPIVHDVTGGLLEVLAASSGAARAVEVGTAIGVSTLHLARGGAHVTSFEVDPERHEQAKRYLARDGRADQVDLRLQDATEGLAELEAGAFDLGFIDGPKAGYSTHLDQIVWPAAAGRDAARRQRVDGGRRRHRRTDGRVERRAHRRHPRVQRRTEGARGPARDLPPRR